MNSNETNSKSNTCSHKVVTMASAISTLLLLTLIVSFSLSFLFSSYLMFSNGINLANKSNGISVRLFAEYIRQNIIAGNQWQALIKCKELLKEPHIEYVEITSKENISICSEGFVNQKKRFIFTSEEQIYFDESQQNLVANIRVGFDMSNFYVAYSKNAGLLLVVMTSFAFFVHLLGRRLSLVISRPLHILQRSVLSRKPQAIEISEIETGKLRIKELLDLTHGFNSMHRNVSEYQDKLRTETRKTTYLDVARRVAHDLRSPLSYLKAIAFQSEEPSEAYKAQIIKAIDSISGITADLLNQQFSTNINEVKNCLDHHASKGSSDRKARTSQAQSNLNCCDEISEIVEEKRVEIQSKNKDIKINLDFPTDCDSFYLLAPRLEFRRTISNILNNSIEAIAGTVGFIYISVCLENDSILIEIRDSGIGIPPDVLSKLGTKGMSYSKEKGNGLGVYYAKKAILSWRGEYNTYSTQGRGTTVAIKVPRHEF